MATTNLDAHDLKGASGGSLIREDVMDRIWDISSIPLPFTDRAGSGSHDNEYTEWTQDKLRDPNLGNKKVDGQDITDNDTNVGTKLGNHSQISTKAVRVSKRANASDTIGTGRELSYQIMMRQRELKRDVEAISLSLQGSVEDDGDTIPGEAGSVFSFIKTHASVGVGGSVPGFNPTTKVTGDVVPGTARGLTEAMVRDIGQAVYQDGGNPSVFMARPAVVRLFSEYCFTSSARIATMTEDVGRDRGPAVAKGAVNVFVTDFGVALELIPNRLQPQTAAGVSSIGIFDFEFIELSYLTGYQVEELAKNGLAENRMMSVDWTLKVLNESAQGAIHAIDETVPVVPGTSAGLTLFGGGEEEEPRDYLFGQEPVEAGGAFWPREEEIPSGYDRPGYPGPVDYKDLSLEENKPNRIFPKKRRAGAIPTTEEGKRRARALDRDDLLSEADREPPPPEELGDPLFRDVDNEGNPITRGDRPEMPKSTDEDDE